MGGQKGQQQEAEMMGCLSVYLENCMLALTFMYAFAKIVLGRTLISTVVSLVSKVL